MKFYFSFQKEKLTKKDVNRSKVIIPQHGIDASFKIHSLNFSIVHNLDAVPTCFSFSQYKAQQLIGIS